MPIKIDKKDKLDKVEKKTVVLLDAHAILHRAYHAMTNFSTRAGMPTGALYGFITMVLRMKEVLKPDYVIACYDLPKPTFRHSAYENYKAGRAKTDDALIEQIKVSEKVCEALGIPVYSKEGFEADDILATIAEQTRGSKELKIIIASGDMDTMQLIEPGRVFVFTLKKGAETVLYDVKAIEARYGFAPLQIPDFKGLSGDPSDNIQGVSGIGEKTATDLIKKYKTVENIYKTIKKDKTTLIKDGFKERTVSLLLDGEEEALFSKTLATVRRDAPIKFVLPSKKWVEGIDDKQYKEMCDKYEFKSLRDKFRDKLEDKFADNLESKETKEEKEPVIDQIKLEKLKVMTNLLDSETTNPSLSTIYDIARAEGEVEAEANLEKELKKEDLYELFINVEQPLMPLIREMEKNGILVDGKILKEQSLKFHGEVKKIEKEIYKLAGKEFAISSPKQLGDVLYDDLGLGIKIKKTSTGARSTNAGELEKMKDTHPIVEKIVEYRELTKLLSTYIDPLPTYIKEDGRIHPHFIQSGAATGRFSCEEPNLQNLPIKTERGRGIREAFISSKGNLLLSLDYAQVDLRCAAILSGDTNLIEIFRKKIDAHTGTAARMFNVKEEDVTPDMRRKAKAINFGILYGMGVNALKSGMKVERSEAQEFYDQYRVTFKRLITFLDEVKSNALKTGFTKTILGRKRRVPLLKSPLPFLRAQGERIAINAPMQGSAADILKLAIIDVNEYIVKNNLKEKVKLLLQIHDELVYEINEEIAEEESKKIQDVMKKVLSNRKLSDLPLEVSISLGKNIKTL